MPEVGFILLTHTRANQILRLVNRLNRSFDYPPIVCHHDFSKAVLDLRLFSRNVLFVQPHLVTRWADFSVVDATVRAFQMMYERPDAPRWSVVLSGSDYPIKPAERVISDLNTGEHDAHIFSILIAQQTRHESPWSNQCFKRYCTTPLVLPSIDRRLRRRQRVLRLRIPWYSARRLPYNDALRCYAGRQWFTVNPKAAEVIIRFHRERPDVAAHYRRVMFSEESYFQTILSNAPGVRINRNDWRYVDFPPRAAHPRTLTVADLSKLLTSPAHFARKFDERVDAQVLDELDRALDYSSHDRLLEQRPLPPSVNAERMLPSSSAFPSSPRLFGAEDLHRPDNR